MPLSSHIHQCGDSHSFQQVHDSTRAVPKMQPQDLKPKLTSPVQSRVASASASLPPQFVPISTLYQGHVTRDSVSQEIKVLSAKKFVAVVMLMIHLVCGFIPNYHGTNVTHMTLSNSCTSAWNRLQVSKACSPTLMVMQ